jgi:hypothetical protein
MGQLTFTARLSPTEVFKGQVQVSDANVRRIIDAYRGLYYPLGFNTGTPEVPVYRPATDQEVVLRLAEGLVDGIKANAISKEREDAKKVAETTVSDIHVDPALP